MEEDMRSRDELHTLLARLRQATATLAAQSGTTNGDAGDRQLERAVLADLSTAVFLIREELASHGGRLAAVLPEALELRAEAGEHLASGPSPAAETGIYPDSSGGIGAPSEVERLRAELAAGREARRALEAQLTAALADLDTLRGEIDRVTATRAWRLAQWYWQVRDRLKRLLRLEAR